VLTPETVSRIKGFIEGFLQNLVEQHKPSTSRQTDQELLAEQFSKKGDLKPFHKVLIPPEIIRINSFERSFSTKLGLTFEETAKLVAQQYHKEVHRSFKFEGQVYREQINQIESSRNMIESKGFKGQNFSVLASNLENYKFGELTARKNVSDLYVVTHADEHWFFEIKTPKPNKDIAVETTRRLLTTWAINQTTYPERRIKTFYAMAYNPYGTRSAYNYSFAKTYLDMQNQVLLQEEFWDMLGGAGTYQEILQIYEEVGNSKAKDLLDQLALGF
jgi:Type II restriction endonuclease, TdeIII